MIRNYYPSPVAKAMLCPRSQPTTFASIFFSLLFVLLFSGAAFSQVANVTQAGVIEAGFGTTPNLTGASSVAIKGNYAYVVGTGDVLEVLDITLPGLPAHKGSLANGTGGAVIQRPQHIVVQGNYAYITSEAANALEIVDISNPAQPVHKSVIYDGGGTAPYLNSAWGLAVSGNNAFVTFATGLEIIDISNPELPVHKGVLLDGGGSAPYLNQAFSVFISGNLAYVGSAGALEIIDISNLALPSHKGALLDGGGSAPLLSNAYSVYVSGSYAYVTDSKGIEIVDVSNPAFPVHAASMLDNGKTAPYILGAFGLTVSGNYLYVVGNRNFEIIDITNPLQPLHKAGLTNNKLLGQARQVVIVGQYAYVPSRASNGLNIMDISDPASPSFKGVAAGGTGGALFSSPNAVFVDNGYAYVGNADVSITTSGFEVVDVSNPSVPLHAGSIPSSSGYHTDGVYAVAKSGNTVFLANNFYNSLVLVDVTNPLNPFRKSSIADGQGGAKLLAPTSVQVHPSGNYAYVTSSGSNAVDVVDVSDGSNPQSVAVLVDGNGSAPYLKDPTSIAISISGATTYGYVTSFTSNALEIIDLSISNVPFHKGSLLDGHGSAPYLKQPKSVFVKGNYAYVASYGSSALEIIDITNPATPLHKGAFKSAILDSLNSVYISGNYAYITCAARSSGASVKGTLEVVDVSDPANPIHYETFTNGASGALIDYPTSVFISGNYAFLTNAGLYESMDVVYLYGPGITSFSPASAAVGATVTVTGRNFNTFVTASINGNAGSVTAVAENTLSFTVPPTASNGKITLGYAGQNFSSATNFIVIPTTAAATTIQQNSFTANWSDVGASSYFFDLSTDNFATFVGGYNNYPLGNLTSLAITGLTPSITYQYRVRSSDGTLISDNSNVMNVLTIPATPVANAAASVNQTYFTASWTTVTGATNYYLDVATDESFTKFLVGYNNLSIQASSDQSQIVTGLASFTQYYYRVRAANATGTSPYSATITVLTPDKDAPVIVPSSANLATITFGNSPTFNVNIKDNVQVDSASIFYKGISHKSFNRIDLHNADADGNYSLAVQSSWLDSLGLEYYFRAVDEAGNKVVSPTTYAQVTYPSLVLPTLPFGDNQSNYRILAFPYVLSSENLSAFYSAVPWNDNTKVGIWWWDPTLKNGSGDYSKFGSSSSTSSFDAGKGYWVLVRNSITPQLTNVTSPNYNKSNLYSMTLKPNWNEIGNPYPVPISWNDVRALNPNTNISPLAIFNGTGYETTDALLPFVGGFVKNNGSTDVTIQIPFPGQVSIGDRVASTGSDVSGDSWNMSLHINQDGASNQLGGFGMHPLATAAPDRYDNFNPPRFLDVPELNFVNSEFPGTNFSNDVVGSQEYYTWQFTPVGSVGKHAQLNWSAGDWGSPSQQLFLFDEELVKVIDMTDVSSYDFVLTSASHFRIFYGANIADKVTSMSVLASTPFPNPLASDSRLTINLALPDSNDPYSVNLQIFDAHGELIGALNKTLSSGIHPLEFSLTSNSLATGIYIYKLSITSHLSSSIHTGKIVKP